MEQKKKFESLFEGYLSNKYSTADVDQIISDIPKDELRRLILQEFYETKEPKVDKTQVQRIVDNVKLQLDEILRKQPKRLINYRTIASVAAAILLCLSIGFYFLMDKPSTPSMISSYVDRSPGTYKATLTLDDGSKVDLNTSKGGLKTDDNTISYEDGSRATSKTTEFATLVTPRGGEYRITLPDGTKVRLNAATSLTYPLQFTDSIRQVTVAGEAYFEVAHNAKKPFVVKSEQQSITVLGTKFNIDTYSEVGKTRTTLVSGRLQLQQYATNKKIVLTPGQEATLNKNSWAVQVVDTENSILWTEGYINLNKQKLEQILSNLSRWYDVDFSIVDRKIEHLVFEGEIPKTKNLSTALAILEKAGNLVFEEKGGVIKVTTRR
ncbi:FecR family protein [Sphingobacterium psychroaquaticum]|uniref:FecR family protein n=1 Tax=Sphingobacterium psychroaquaticum TaxID=561061 RepID=A0A1X7K0Q6_9SPHI|nr:FecR domain-containing protein [Sphingobacterium psychroaquaticum]SMG34477.1 FecR family protein [Sphingobacterium psychroaquaticum]